MRTARLVLALALVVPATLGAQTRIRANTAALFESYRFGSGLVFNRVSELTVPLGVTVQLGSLGNVALSSGYARVDLKTADPTQLSDQQISGVMDTEVRLSVNILPGKLVALVTGAIPTGVKTVELEELSILGALSSDVIGFAASNLGTGGSVGGGFAGALPLGRFAIGLGATMKQPLGYTPVLGEPDRLTPGNELRFRAGVEGPLARRTYLRAAGIVARTAKDQVGGVTRHGVGNRFIGYLSVNQGLGPASITLYGFDVFRGDPQIEQTAVGAAVLPRGNLLAGGVRVDWPLGPVMSVSPRAEFRVSTAAPDTGVTRLERLGRSVRVGLDARRQLTPLLAVVLQGDGVTGHVMQGGSRITFDGFRAALHLELTP